MTRILKIFGGFAILTAILWISGLKLFMVSVTASDVQYAKAKTDAIVVLTGGDFRIKKGMDLWAQDLAPKLFISGINKEVSREKILEEWTKDEPLPECCLILGYEATSTSENATETQNFVQQENISSIRLVTSQYHMPRALMEFKNVLPGVQIYTHPVESDINGKRYWNLMISEYHKGLWRKLTLLSHGNS